MQFQEYIKPGSTDAFFENAYPVVVQTLDYSDGLSLTLKCEATETIYVSNSVSVDWHTYRAGSILTLAGPLFREVVHNVDV